MKPILLTIAVMLIFSFTGCASIKRLANGEFQKVIGQNNSNPVIISDKDLAGLPEPVKRYLSFAGVIGKERTRTVHVRFSGEMKMSENQNWLPVQVDQVSGLDNPVRIFYISGRLAPLLTIDGRDKYKDGKGNMFIKLLSLITVADSRGMETDASELVTFLNDMIFIPAAFC